ncbi:MAG: helix-turn-helix domain-containing protein [Candidatus Woesearchaeota archaeon]|jgi:predicted DNA binding protein
MWITKLKTKHDCVIGNRCEKFKVTTTGTPFNVFIEKGITYSPQIQTLQGDEVNIKEFIKDFKKEKRIINLEIEGNTIFFIEVRKDKIPSTFYHTKLIFVKPVFVDKSGYECWEVASWKKEILSKFIVSLEKEIKNVEILKIEETKISDIYFAHLLPDLTSHQKRALELAFEEGFYAWPKRTDFGKLANIMHVSVPTFREHLKRAEEKLMPDLIKSIK